jgi:hypothetical protein
MTKHVGMPLSSQICWESMNRRIVIQASLGTEKHPILQNNQCKKGWVVAQVVEHLPHKCNPWVQTLYTHKKIRK